MGGGLTEVDWVELLMPQRKKEVQFDPPRMFCPCTFPVVAEAQRENTTQDSLCGSGMDFLYEGSMYEMTDILLEWP